MISRVVLLLARDQSYRVTAAEGASHPGSLGIGNILVRTNDSLENIILPSSYHEVSHITYLCHPYGVGPV